MSAAFHFKARPELRARAEACARLIGASVAEFAREAIRDKCAEVEKLYGQRERARKAAKARADARDE